MVGSLVVAAVLTAADTPDVFTHKVTGESFRGRLTVKAMGVFYVRDAGGKTRKLNADEWTVTLAEREVAKPSTKPSAAPGSGEWFKIQYERFRASLSVVDAKVLDIGQWSAGGPPEAGDGPLAVGDVRKFSRRFRVIGVLRPGEILVGRDAVRDSASHGDSTGAPTTGADDLNAYTAHVSGLDETPVLGKPFSGALVYASQKVGRSRDGRRQMWPSFRPIVRPTLAQFRTALEAGLSLRSWRVVPVQTTEALPDRKDRFFCKKGQWFRRDVEETVALARTQTSGEDKAGWVPVKNVQTGTTPLHRAAKKGDTAAIKRLLAEGKEVNGQDDDGNTPLHLAILANEKAAAMGLLEGGADPRIKNKKGRTARWLAINAHWGHEEMRIRQRAKELGMHGPR